MPEGEQTYVKLTYFLVTFLLAKTLIMSKRPVFMSERIIGIAALAICLPVWMAFTEPVFPAEKGKDNMLTDSEKRAGWRLLFDGRTTKGWRTYKNAQADSWEVANGQLHCKKDAALHHADLVTVKEYASFELQLDWKVEKAANSGVLYHVGETHDHAYETGPEYQLIDDFGYPEALEDWQQSGADYAMHPPSKIASRPQGEYNHSRIVVDGDHIEHWLNGFKVADFKAWTPEWQQLRTSGKWKDYPDYGSLHSGLIDLQDHGGGIWFKNIKIKVLSPRKKA